MSENKQFDYCGTGDDYLDGCDGDNPLYDYKGDPIATETEGLDYCGIEEKYLDGCGIDYPLYDYKGDPIRSKTGDFMKRIFLPSQI